MADPPSKQIAPPCAIKCRVWPQLSANRLPEIKDAALSAKTDFLQSNSDARRALKENAISVNKEKVGETYQLTSDDLINNKYIIINKGKKNTYIIKVV